MTFCTYWACSRRCYTYMIIIEYRVHLSLWYISGPKKNETNFYNTKALLKKFESKGIGGLYCPQCLSRSVLSNFLLYSNVFKDLLPGSYDHCCYSVSILQYARHRSLMSLMFQESPEGKSCGDKLDDLAGQPVRPFLPIHEFALISSKRE